MAVGALTVAYLVSSTSSTLRNHPQRNTQTFTCLTLPSPHSFTPSSHSLLNTRYPSLSSLQMKGEPPMVPWWLFAFLLRHRPRVEQQLPSSSYTSVVLFGTWLEKITQVIQKTSQDTPESGLSFQTTKESLTNAFKNFGEPLEVNLVMDRIANRPRGFAFLRYATEEESRKAIEGMHGKFLDGRVIFVEVAKPRWEVRKSNKQSS